MKIDCINILGTNVPLTFVDKKEAKGLTVGIIVSFYIYKGFFQDTEYIFYQSKNEKEFTPSDYAYYSNKITEVFNKPVILITNKRDYNNRIRLYDQGVYLVAGSNYVYLPNLVVNTLGRTPKKKRVKQLSPKAQFLLLYWLQEKSLGPDVSIGTFLGKWSFSYISISRALAELEQYGFCDSVKGIDNSKTYHFLKERKAIWEDGQELMRNPVSRIVYSNEPIPEGFRVTSISALSHYSWLNPENVETVAVLASVLRQSSWKAHTNEIEGKYCIEIWCYEPAMFEGERYVDRLSLVLSLKENPDARVEGEVKRVINEMQW